MPTLPSHGLSGSIPPALRTQGAVAQDQEMRPVGQQWGKELAVSASNEIAKHTLISGGVILAVGTLTGFLAQKIKIPAEVALMSIRRSASGPIDMPTIRNIATSHAIGTEGRSSS